jgi:hypothetical protein
LSDNRRSIRGFAVVSSAALAVGGLTIGIDAFNAWADEPGAAPSRAPVATAALLGSSTTADEQVAAIQTVAKQKAEQRRKAAKRLAEKRRKAQLRRKAELRRAAQAAAEARDERERASRSVARQTFSGDARGIAAQIAQQQYGWGAGQFSCLNSLWAKESGWSYQATNASSGAYGIPQALPGSKMAAFGSDWQTNPATQIKWGLNYINGRYGSPCSAWSTAQSQGWY